MFLFAKMSRYGCTCISFPFLSYTKNNSTVNTVFLSFFFLNLTMHSGTLSTLGHRDLIFFFFLTTV